MAHAEYGYLYARTASVVKNWSVDYPPHGGGAYGYFEDIVTFVNSGRIWFAQADWDSEDLGFSEVIFGASYVGEGQLVVSASVTAGYHPYGIFLDGEAWARIVGIRVYDLEGRQLTSGLYYTSDSGTAYPIEGASQIPEPESGSLLLAALVAGIGRYALHGRGRLKTDVSGEYRSGSSGLEQWLQ